MIEVSQSLVLAGLVILWGAGTFLNSATSARRNLGLLQILLGWALFSSTMISHFTSGAAIGELFFVVTTLTLAAVITLLILTTAHSDIGEVTAFWQAKLQNPAVKSAADLWRLVKSGILAAEEGDFRVQITLFFFFAVLILLIQLT